MRISTPARTTAESRRHTSVRAGIFRSAACLLAAAGYVAIADCALAAPPAARALTIDDVLDITRIDSVAPSPDGEFVAVAVQRPARAGEVFGRTAYEVDPGRADIWLISLKTGQKRNLTRGQELAAGFWCPSWSPDGSKLAMLSTKPEPGEPRGGNNVRIYLWDRSGEQPRRLSSAAVTTQTRYGSPMRPLDLRGGAAGESVHRCSDEENAPFLWLDQKRLLAVTLPDGQVSGLIDEYARPVDQTARTSEALRAGTVATVTALGSGRERLALKDRTENAELRILDTASPDTMLVAKIPIYSVRGELTISVSPDWKQAAVLAPVGGMQPAKGQSAPSIDETWLVEKRLGFVDLKRGSSLRWSQPTAGAEYPLELFAWSPDSRKVAFRARGSLVEKSTPLFIASSDRLATTKVGGPGVSVGGPYAGAAFPRESEMFWLDGERLLARLETAQGGQGPQRIDWWSTRPGEAAKNITAGLPEAPRVLRRIGADRFLAISGDKLFTLTMSGGTANFSPPEPLAPGSSAAWPREGGAASATLVLEQPPSGTAGTSYRILPSGASVRSAIVTLPPDCQLTTMDPMRGTALCVERARTGTYLKAVSAPQGPARTLLETNRHLSSVTWGEPRIIDYKTKAGEALKAAVILPPGYSPGERYPVVTWVYPGYQVRGPQSYFLDPYLPGIYNLQLYAARGYVVLIPSLPLSREAVDNEMPDLAGPTLAAVDELVRIGIADGERVAVMGQSYGGFGVYALVGQTSRFKAAIALSGGTDFTRFYGSFSATARGYPGIEHELSLNWVLAEIGQVNLQSTPFEKYELYWRRSPLAFVDRVDTPLLLIHGEYDKRAPMAEAEAFYMGLYRQGKTARLLRYWGESHSLAQSPANIRSIYEETLAWLDKYMPRAPARAR